VPDVVVVGAGVVGASVAFHLAERRVDTLVIDAAGQLGGQTPRSGAIVRGHHATVAEASLAWESLTGYFERWDERVGGGCGFTRTGFAYLADERDAAAVRANVAMLRPHGLAERLVEPEELAELDPAVVPDGISVVAYEERAGYADPVATTLGLLAAARRLGARVERTRAVSVIETAGGRVGGVRTDSGERRADTVLLAAGAWTPELAAGVGVRLPIRPARIQVMLYQRPPELATHLAMTDVANDTYLRPTAELCTLVGRHAPEREWLAGPDVDTGEPDESFVRGCQERLARRMPCMRDAPYRLGRTCALDITPDRRPVLGPAGPDGLHLAAGWSGSGFGKAPAIGAELARWIVDGEPKRPELAGFGPDRFGTGKLISGRHEYGATGPH
jgi:sarcosine oxidase subunit beta